MGARKISPLLRKYQGLQRAKKKYCQGKSTKAAVTKAEKAYIAAAVKKGQTKIEATRKAKRVTNGGCKMTSRVGKKKKR